MTIKQISDRLSLSEQIQLADITSIAEQGFRSIIVNRPDSESEDQPDFAKVQQAAEALGLVVQHLPVVPGKISDQDIADFAQALEEMPAPVLAYCRTGTRSAFLWALSQAGKRPAAELLAISQSAGYDLSSIAERLCNAEVMSEKTSNSEQGVDASYDVVIVGAGAGGIATAASLLVRLPSLNIAIIDPADVHYYQPGWTMVGGGIFQPEETARSMHSLIPKGVNWIRTSVTAFQSEQDRIALDNGQSIGYKRLVVCPGLKLNWDKVEGLSETLGRNGVTSNYRYDLAPYTWSLVKGLESGNAIFTQPPMPIKCAGAPQKALYLSADHWYRTGRIKDIDISFNNAGGVLFGVKEYVPALQNYMDRCQASLNYFYNLIAVDGPAGKAWFDVSVPDKPVERVEAEFDMMHVCPPQCAPDFISQSPLADAAGWVDIDQSTLRHKRHENIWALGDVSNTPNAKTAAAARKQAPVVAANIVADINGKSAMAIYDGYGSCPLTVERGKVVLAEFGYGGKLLPSFPGWLLDGTKPTHAAWLLKAKLLPPIYWQAMLKGREWMAKPGEPEVSGS